MIMCSLVYSSLFYPSLLGCWLLAPLVWATLTSALNAITMTLNRPVITPTPPPDFTTPPVFTPPVKAMVGSDGTKYPAIISLSLDLVGCCIDALHVYSWIVQLKACLLKLFLQDGASVFHSDLEAKMNTILVRGTKRECTNYTAFG